MKAPRAIVVRPRPSLWRRFFARFDRRTKAELVLLVDHLEESRLASEKRHDELYRQFMFLTEAFRQSSLDLDAAKRILRVASQGLVSMAELEEAARQLRCW